MAGAFTGDTGGIAGLLDVIDNHQAALELDLIRCGLRLRNLGTPDFTWRDLMVIVRGTVPGSALFRSIRGPEDDTWGPMQTQLMALLFDAMQINSYYLQKLAGGNPDPPEPLPRPGVSKPRVEWSGHPRSIDEMDQLLGWNQ